MECDCLQPTSDDRFHAEEVNASAPIIVPPMTEREKQIGEVRPNPSVFRKGTHQTHPWE